MLNGTRSLRRASYGPLPMSKRIDIRLFDLDEVGPKVSKPAKRRRHLHVVEISPQSRLNLDGAPLYFADDSLLLRGVQPHSADKAIQVSRGLDTVSLAMSRQWFDVQYVETHCGPGLLLDEESGQEVAGSPLQALNVSRPFRRYVFSDLSTECTSALSRRIGERPDVRVETGDANDRAHLERVFGPLDPRALTLVYLDPACPSHLQFKTIEWLARRFNFLDLIINLPIHGLRRAVTGAGSSFEGPGAAGMFLAHPEPRRLLAVPDLIKALRDTYDEQLMNLGFLKPARRTVTFAGGAPYYDMLYVSKHPTALKLWNNTNPVKVNPQLDLLSGDLAG